MNNTHQHTPNGELFAVEELSSDFGFYLRGSEILANTHSPMQHIEIMHTPLFGRVMRIDGCFMTSEADEFFYHEPMVHLPAITHGNPRQALIIGGGDGGAAYNLLRYPNMERVVLAELDQAVVDMARTWLPKIHRGALDDPRLELHIGDGAQYMQNIADSGTQSFDQIVLDLTDPFGPATALYTRDFYRLCKRCLKPNGVLSLHMQSPIHLGHVMARVFASVRSVFATVRPYLQYVPLYGTLWTMAMASNHADPLTLPASTIDARLAQHGIDNLKLYNGATHHSILNLPPFVQSQLHATAQPIDAGEELLQAPTGNYRIVRS